MRWLREHKIFSVVAGLVIFLLIVIFAAYASGSGSSVGNGFRGILTTIQKPFSKLGGGIKNAYNGIFNYDELQDENSKLKEENKKLKRELNSNAIKKDELKRLESLYNALDTEPFAKDIDPVAANVISVDNSNGYIEFTVDVGSDKGVKKGNLVVDDKGIVGIVLAVDKTSAKISSIIDSSVKMSFILKKNMDAIGIVSGDGDKYMQGYMVDETLSVSEGDLALTSGIGGFPKGIAIGKITKVEYDSNKQLKVVKIKPTSNFKSMQKVAIIR